jgi:preprotein translocase subunit SecY
MQSKLLVTASLVVPVSSLPIKVNSAGVMPIIFAQAIMFLPTLFNFNSAIAASETGQGLQAIFTDHSNIWYMVIYTVVVIGFTFLYTALIFNPKQIADNLKQNNGFIPGVKPGQPTVDYIGAVMDKITLPGAILLALVGISTGHCAITGCYPEFLYVLRRNFFINHGWCNLRYLATDRDSIVNEAVRWINESGRIQGRQTLTQAY